MPDYDFHTLSPMDFELLVKDLLQAKLGVELKAFAHGPDGGVDLRGNASGETIVVQCKHYRGSSFHDLARSARKENSKMDSVRPATYIFVTSQNLTPGQADQLAAILAPHLRSADDIYTAHDLNGLLGVHPEIERNHFKLWMASATVIQRIVSSGIWRRSEALMEEIQDRVKIYVSTPAFNRARVTMDEKYVCVITGAPGVGKSMLADMLALAHWQAGWKVVELPSHEISRAWDVWQGDEKQLFYFDDVFGQTDVQERLSHDGGKIVAQLISRVGRSSNKRLIVTTRTHILQEAEARDEPLSRAGLRTRECEVHVEEYTRINRARVLYNHLYFSELNREAVREFVNNGWHLQVIDHVNFTPRLIELAIVQQGHSGTAGDLLHGLMHALDHPVELWGPSFREALTEPARRILLHLVTFPTHGAHMDALRVAAEQSATPLEYHRALNQLEGSWIEIGNGARGGAIVASFRNPSCRDFVLAFLDNHPEYIERICRNAGDISEIAQLVRYAQSITGGKNQPKYPGLRRMLRQIAADVSDRVRALYDQQRHAGVGVSIDALLTFMGASNALEFGLRGWALDQALALSAWIPLADGLDGDTAGVLATVIVDEGRFPVTKEEAASCRLIYLAWCNAVGEYSEWDQVFGFGSWLESHNRFSRDSDDSIVVSNAFERWLDGELDGTLASAANENDAMSWMEDVRQVATQYFGEQRFSAKFDNFEGAVDEKFRLYEPSWEEMEYLRTGEPIESSPMTSITLSSRVGGTSVEIPPTEADEIKALFEQLG